MAWRNNPDQPLAEVERHRISALVFEHIAEAVAVTNRRGRIMVANPAFARMVGKRAESLRGEYLDRYLATHDENLRPVLRPDWANGATRNWRGEVWLHGQQGFPTPAWLTFAASTAGDSGLQPWVACFTDLTEQHRQNRAMWDMAHTDRITGLPNFRSFEELAEQALNQGVDACGHVIVFHICGLSDIVGVHGHLAGEQILRRLSARLQSLFPQVKGLFYLDSGEFGVLLPGAVQDEAMTLAKSSLASLMESVQTEDHHFHLKPYAGVCGYPEAGANANELIRHARLAVDQARRTGPPCVRNFDLSQDASLRERLLIDAHLNKALDNKELKLVYQPQIDLESGQCIGAEALLRWHSAVLGDISPDRFVPIAESNGAMLEIGRWVLDEACRQMRAWQVAGQLRVPVAVNVSAPQLLEDDLPMAVAEALEKHQLAPEWLEIELTEGLLLTDSHRAGEALNRLAEMGVGLALDDFGTGYASFSYLQRFQFHRLKIDRSLIRHVAERPRDTAIVRAIIGMGRALDMQILAEGIETVEQAEALRETGCDIAQGFLYSRPIPSQQAGAWISRYATT